MSKKWHARWPIPISDAAEPASTLAAVLCVIIRVFVIVLLPCNIFQGRSVSIGVSMKSRWSVRFWCLYRCMKCHCRLPWRIWCCRPSQWAHGVCRRGQRCVCVRATGTCRVVWIGSPISLLGTSDIGAQLPFYLQCVKLPPMCRCPMSDIIIGLTLITF